MCYEGIGMKKSKVTKKQMDAVNNPDAVSYWRHQLTTDQREKYYLDVFWQKIGEQSTYDEIVVEAIQNAYADAGGIIKVEGYRD